MDAGKITFDVELNSKKFDEQILQAEDKLESLVEEYKILKKAKPFEGQEKQLIEMRAEIEKTQNQLIDLKAKSFDTTSVQNKGFEKTTKKLKRFALSLFSVASIYSLVSRASQAYLNKNQATANKLQAIWNTLGDLLGPIIETIVNSILKLIGYISEFVKVLSNGKIDIAETFNKNAKAINKTAKAQKELNRQTYSFDKINKLSSSSSTTGTTTSTGKVPEIKISELNQGVIDKLKDMAKWLQENWDWIWKVGVALGTVFGVAKITGIIDNIAKLCGASGLGKLATSLSGLTTVVAIAITISNIKQILDDIGKVKKQLQEMQEQGEKAQKTWLQGETDINKIIDTQNVNRTNGYQKLVDSRKTLAKITGLSKTYLDQAISIVKNSGYQLDKMKEIVKLEGTTTDQKQKTLEAWLQQYVYIQNVRNELIKNKQSTKEVDEVASKYIETIKNAGTELGLNNQELDTMISNIGKSNSAYQKVYDEIGKINNEPLKDKTATYNIKTTADTSSARISLGELFSNIGKSIAKIPSKIFGIDVSGIGNAISSIWKKKLAVGGIVNNPGKGVMLGNVQTGEAGREGVLPLTDPNTMRELGIEIAKYIKITTQIDNYIDSTKLNRVLTNTQNLDNFLNNK